MLPDRHANTGLIFIVDDDDILRTMMRAELEEEGHTVVEASDGQAAFELCAKQTPDLVVADVMMPRMDGFELCRALRDQTETAFLPILMATGLDDAASIALAYDAGATDFIAKPLSWVMLTHRIRYMLRAARAFTAIRDHEVKLLKAVEAAETANRTKTEFLANMSHELRTPLNAIIGFSDLIRERTFGPIADRYLEYIVHIGESGTHLLTVINDILDYSKAEVKRLVLNEDEIEITTVVTLATAVVSDMADKAGIRYSVDIDPRLPLFRGDMTKLRQILINLLGNAVKFTPAGGSIVLKAGLGVDGGLFFLVRDSGIGIPSDKMSVALAPFGQVDGSLARRYGGTGLGLPLTTALVELHGGVLTLTSEVGKGTDATASFPADRFVAGPVETAPLRAIA
jgi:signal transduction histidine kinase